jgi:L-lactate dehydrogenase (cytochrome)
MKMSRALDSCHNILDIRGQARRRLPAPIFHFLDGGAETEITASRNTAAFDDEKLVPRCLVDVSSVKTSTRVLGQDIQWPVLCSPTGAGRLFHPEGELAVARAAASTGTLYGVATGSTYSLEDVAAESQGPKMFQLYIFRDRDLTRQLVERSKRAGYGALCLTVDVPVVGKRERDLRTGFNMQFRWTPRGLLSFARHPAWVVGQLRRGALYTPNYSQKPRSRNPFSQRPNSAAQLDPSITWKDVRAISDQWGGPFALKGVMSADDARRAADAGATAVIVSNHGGRQLDGAAASIEVLPEIVGAVGDHIEVILDGGIRRGVHVLKALARGAKACSVGRPYLYGLSVGGESGVVKVLEILRKELVLAMQLSGCPDVHDIDEHWLRRSA